MTKRFLTALMMMAAFVLVAAPTPAQATDYQWLKTRCYNSGLAGFNDPVHVCTTVGFRTQDDGSGVRAEDLWVDVNQGCGSLESSYPYIDNTVWIGPRSTEGSTYTEKQELSDFADCHVYRDLEVKGPDTGDAWFRWRGWARINNSGDRWHETSFAICRFNNC